MAKARKVRRVKRVRKLSVDPISLWRCAGCSGDFGLWLTSAQIRDLGL